MLIYSEKEKWYIHHHESTHYQTHSWRYYDIHSIFSRGSDSSSKRRLMVKYNQCCIVSTRMVSPRIDYKKVTKGRRPLNYSIKSMNYWRRMIHPKSRIIILNYIITWNHFMQTVCFIFIHPNLLLRFWRLSCSGR